MSRTYRKEATDHKRKGKERPLKGGPRPTDWSVTHYDVDNEDFGEVISLSEYRSRKGLSINPERRGL